MTRARPRHGRPRNTLPSATEPLILQRSNAYQVLSLAFSRELAVIAPGPLETMSQLLNQAEAAPKM